MRSGQSLFRPEELTVECYVDDPLVIACGNEKSRKHLFTALLPWWRALGVAIAWDKIDVGSAVDWCGTEASVVSSTTMKAAWPDKFTSELEHEARDMLSLRVVELMRLRKFAGRSSGPRALHPRFAVFLRRSGESWASWQKRW